MPMDKAEFMKKTRLESCWLCYVVTVSGNVRIYTVQSGLSAAENDTVSWICDVVHYIVLASSRVLSLNLIILFWIYSMVCCTPVSSEGIVQ
jgi:hypothetical protein